MKLITNNRGEVVFSIDSNSFGDRVNRLIKDKVESMFRKIEEMHQNDRWILFDGLDVERLLFFKEIWWDVGRGSDVEFNLKKNVVDMCEEDDRTTYSGSYNVIEISSKKHSKKLRLSIQDSRDGMCMSLDDLNQD